MNAQPHPARRGVPRLLVAMRDPVTDNVRQMLLQRSAAGDVDHLHAAKMAEDRQPTSVRGPAKLQLIAVSPSELRREQQPNGYAAHPCVCCSCAGIASKF
jgi:hypothetical protein